MSGTPLTLAQQIKKDEIIQKNIGAGEVPGSIKTKGDEFIISKIGKSRFDSWIKYQFGNSYKDAIYVCTQDNPACTHYQLSYRLKVPDKPFVDYFFSFEMDGHAHLIHYDRLPYCIENHEACVLSLEKLPLPNCVHTAEECGFPIDGLQGREIAKRAGFEKGMREWKTYFTFYNKTFVWIVRNTLFANSTGGESGKEMVIDANSGSVLETRKWRSMYTPSSGTRLPRKQ